MQRQDTPDSNVIKQAIPVVKSTRSGKPENAKLKKADSNKISEQAEELESDEDDIKRKLDIVEDELSFKRVGNKPNKFFQLPPSEDEKEDVEEDVDDFIELINKKK